MTIVWQQTPKRKPRQSIYSPQISTSDFVFILQSPSRHARRTEYYINVAPFADHRQRDKFNKQNLVYRFMGPIGQLAKALASEFVFFGLSDNSYSVDLISQSTHYYWKRFLTALLRACAMTLPIGLSGASDLSLAVSSHIHFSFLSSSFFFSSFFFFGNCNVPMLLSVLRQQQH